MVIRLRLMKVNAVLIAVVAVLAVGAFMAFNLSDDSSVADDAVQHSVTYDVDGGSMPAPVQAPVGEGEGFTLAAYGGTKPGHAFAGWSDGMAQYNPGSTYTMRTMDVTLTAIWNSIVVRYSVSYDANGGSVSGPSTTSAVEGEVIILASYYGIKHGCTFEGWSDGIREYKPRGQYVIGNHNVNFVAIWAPESTQRHMVTYDVNGGSSPAPQQEPLFEGSTFTLAQYSGTKEGSMFRGWSDSLREYAPGETYVMKGYDVTFTAVWEGISSAPHLITYDVNGGSLGAPPQIMAYEGQMVSLQQYYGIRDGYDFKGWSDGKGTYGAGSSYRMGSSDVTLTAIWKSQTGGDDNEVDPLVMVAIVLGVVILALGSAMFIRLWRHGSL